MYVIYLSCCCIYWFIGAVFLWQQIALAVFVSEKPKNMVDINLVLVSSIRLLRVVVKRIIADL